MSQTLKARTLELVQDRLKSMTLQRLATELDMDYFWLRRFVNSERRVYDADKVQGVYEKLSGKQIEL